MYRPGHLGVSMAIYAPLGAALVVLGAIELAVVAGVVMLWLAMLPDVDHRLPLVSHRGATHSLAFALLVGAGFGAAGVVVGASVGGGSTAGAVGLATHDVFGLATHGVAGAVTLGLFGFGLGVATVGAHLLADTLTPSGVGWLWPASSRTYTIGFCRADNPIANYGLLALGAGVLGATAWLLGRLGYL